MLCYVVLNYNDCKTTIECINNIMHYSSIDVIIIVDNHSTDDSLEVLSKYECEKIKVISTDHNGGYGSGNNYGILYAKHNYDPEFIVISNPDAIIDEKTINSCISYLKQHSNTAVVVPKMLDKNYSACLDCVWKIPSYMQYLLFSLRVLGKIVKSFRYDPSMFNIKGGFDCECVAGSWYAARTNDILEAGLYDENIFLYCEETTLGIKLREHGFVSHILTDETFVHNHSVSISKSIKSEFKQRKIMWRSRIYVLDNYYNSSVIHRLFSRVIASVAIIEFGFIRIIKHIIKK